MSNAKKNGERHIFIAEGDFIDGPNGSPVDAVSPKKAAEALLKHVPVYEFPLATLFHRREERSM